MAVIVAEYFGQKTENNPSLINPVSDGDCPFMNAKCAKLKQKKKPVCTVRKRNGDLWIVCSHRLCSTTKNLDLSDYQKQMLFAVAKCTFGEDVLMEDIAVRREEQIPVVDGSKYKADYIMINKGPRGRQTGQKKFVLEMQGGGETSSTGGITRNIETWELNSNRTNEDLAKNAKSTRTIYS